MLHVEAFTFNPFSENTYVVYEDKGDCIIFDPGVYNAHDEMELSQFIEHKELRPVYLINTHCHIDHIMGNEYISKKYGLELYAHKLEADILKMGRTTALMYGLHYNPSPEIAHFIDENDVIMLGKETLKILFTPGHSPGSICFYSESSGFVISGDVLFRQSIGRTDLPGGHHETLLKSIKTQMYNLPDETIVYSGHGPETQIGYEKTHNPFVQG